MEPTCRSQNLFTVFFCINLNTPNSNGIQCVHDNFFQERRKETERMAREREELRRQQEQLRYEQEKRNHLKRGREVEHG